MAIIREIGSSGSGRGITRTPRTQKEIPDVQTQADDDLVKPIEDNSVASLNESIKKPDLLSDPTPAPAAAAAPQFNIRPTGQASGIRATRQPRIGHTAAALAQGAGLTKDREDARRFGLKPSETGKLRRMQEAERVKGEAKLELAAKREHEVNLARAPGEVRNIGRGIDNKSLAERQKMDISGKLDVVAQGGYQDLLRDNFRAQYNEISAMNTQEYSMLSARQRQEHTIQNLYLTHAALSESDELKGLHPGTDEYKQKYVDSLNEIAATYEAAGRNEQAADVRRLNSEIQLKGMPTLQTETYFDPDTNLKRTTEMKTHSPNAEAAVKARRQTQAVERGHNAALTLHDALKDPNSDLYNKVPQKVIDALKQQVARGQAAAKDVPDEELDNTVSSFFEDIYGSGA